MNLRLCMFGIAVFSILLLLPTWAFSAAVPSSRDVRVEPGMSSSTEIQIENTSTSSTVLSISLMSVRFIDGNDQPVLEKLASGIASWVSLSRDSYSLIQGEESSVALLVAPPVDTPSQVFSVAVVVTEILPGQISLSHGSAILVFITIGDVKPNGRCVSFSKMESTGERMLISNAGRGILVADGQIMLRGPFGIRMAQTDINPLHHRVLSNQTRSWIVSPPVIPWWAFGSFSLNIEGANVSIDACSPISAGNRWWPVLCILILFGAGSVVLFRTKRS